MKKLMSIALVVFVSVFMFSCGGKDDPQAVAKDFMKALGDKDYKKAKDLGTENTVMMIGMIESMASMGGETTEAEKAPELTWGETKVDGDKAECHYTSADKPGVDQKLDLVKQDGKWKVDMKKEM
jgi:hypothetical protein